MEKTPGSVNKYKRKSSEGYLVFYPVKTRSFRRFEKRHHIANNREINVWWLEFASVEKKIGE